MPDTELRAAIRQDEPDAISEIDLETMVVRANQILNDPLSFASERELANHIRRLATTLRRRGGPRYR
jgi:hypothetical protein